MNRSAKFLMAAALMFCAACGIEQGSDRCATLFGAGIYCLQPTSDVSPVDLRQKLNTVFRGRRETMIGDLAIDGAGLRFVGLTPFGQQLLQLDYDNRRATVTAGPGIELPPALLVALMQLALWPAQSVRSGLAPPLWLDEKPDHRTIMNAEAPILNIRYGGGKPPFASIRILGPDGAFELGIETLPFEEAGASGESR